jgi:hypothetical protein
MSKLTVAEMIDANSDIDPITPTHIGDVLAEARSIIYGDRERVYGEPAKNLNAIACGWEAYLTSRFNHVVTLTAEDVCAMMVLLKTMRLANSPGHHDSLVDICGYAALTERCGE